MILCVRSTTLSTTTITLISKVIVLHTIDHHHVTQKGTSTTSVECGNDEICTSHTQYTQYMAAARPAQPLSRRPRPSVARTEDRNPAQKPMWAISWAAHGDTRKAGVLYGTEKLYKPQAHNDLLYAIKKLYVYRGGTYNMLSMTGPNDQCGIFTVSTGILI